MAISQQRLAEILNKGRFGDGISKSVDLALSVLILLNLVAVCLESVESIEKVYGSQLFIFEMISVSVFAVEYALRLYSAPKRTDLQSDTAMGRRLEYMFSFTGVVDLLALIPSFLQWLIPGADLRWLRALRMIRLLKLSHYSSALEDLVSAIYEERRAFGAALYLLGIALFLASALIYVAENAVQPDVFSSIPETMWWAIITLTTVGYGDVSPITPLGKLIGALTALMGVCTVALLTGIVGSAFANQLEKRKAIFEAEVDHALADGTISTDEAEHIERLREEFNLSEDHAHAIIASLTERHKTGN
ncbi:ion transporter [Litorivicinus sp.]|jgi:voltage-gated potassium channel|nr:ion transporter [Litorivicinus sp.]MDC1209160.1 ion transporter [Litorivicinus sp.]MDC1240800.1 ion transporter [Litorivicinus sp.]|tara:strand:- start:876 stop:1790 length:915 start_codon:yes stop_codon:yes gene_type:complete